MKYRGLFKILNRKENNALTEDQLKEKAQSKLINRNPCYTIDPCELKLLKLNARYMRHEKMAKTNKAIHY